MIITIIASKLSIARPRRNVHDIVTVLELKSDNRTISGQSLHVTIQK